MCVRISKWRTLPSLVELSPINLHAWESVYTGYGRIQTTSRKDIIPSTAFNCFMQIEAATYSAEHELSTTTVWRKEPHTIGTPFTITIQPETDCFFGPTAKEASVYAVRVKWFDALTSVGEPESSRSRFSDSSIVAVYRSLTPSSLIMSPLPNL
jgi:hypothetical protein